MTPEDIQKEAEKLQANVFAASIKFAHAVAEIGRQDELHPIIMLMAVIRAAGTLQSVQPFMPLHVSVEGFLLAADADQAMIDRVKKAMVQ